MHNRDFCLYYKSNTPAISTPGGLTPVDMIVESPEWGNGLARGMFVVFNDLSYDSREFLTFPGENPKYRRN